MAAVVVAVDFVVLFDVVEPLSSDSFAAFLDADEHIPVYLALAECTTKYHKNRLASYDLKH